MTALRQRLRDAGKGKVEPGAGAGRPIPKPPRLPGAGIATKIRDAVRSKANPESTPAWKERQKKIENRNLRNTGARVRKSGRI